MRQPEKPALLRWLYRSDFDEIVAFRSVLEQGAQTVLQKDAPAAEAYAESNVNSVWSYLLQAQEEDERRGISRIFHVVDPIAMTLRWCPPRLQNALTDPRAVRLSQRPAILRMIDSLTDREFEALGCVAMLLAGATEIVLTPAGNEGGVDFFALISFPSRCHLFAGGVHPLRIIGQSKKYSSAVQVGRFKEFLKTIDEVKYGGELKTEKVIPPWFHAVRGPIVGLMIAHCGFQSGAETRARRHGVIVADSLDMAEMVSLSKGIAGDLTGVQRVSECKLRISQLLA